MEYEQDGVGMIGGFADVGFGGLLAGAQIPQAAAYLASRELLNRLLVAALALLICAAVIGLFWSHRITRPIERLSQATREIGQGQFNISVRVKSRDEIARTSSPMVTSERRPSGS